MDSYSEQSYAGVYRDRRVDLDQPVGWPDGTRLMVTPILPSEGEGELNGHVIIVGFGLAGRCVADLLDRAKRSYTIIEKNPITVETQRALGRDIIQGCGTDPDTLIRAGLHVASILALTMPDEEAALSATELARRLHPEVYIIVRTNYSSKGMKASQLGANDVIKAEQVVALQFHNKLSRRLAARA